MKNIIKMLLISFVICLIVIIIKDQYQYKLLDNANYGMASLIKKDSINNLYIGSSMFRQGIDPQYLDDDSYILSYNGNQPVMEEWIINNLLKHNLKINNLYFDLYPYILSDEVKISDSKIFMEEDIKGKWELYKLFYNNDIGNFYKIFVTENNEAMLTWPIYYKLINSTYSNGGVREGRDGLTSEEISEITIPDVNKVVNPKQIKSLINIINLCKKNNINLVFIETPKYKKILDDEIYNDLKNQFIKVINDSNSQYILANDIDNSISNDSINFIDLIHLSNQGREKYTKTLVNKINSER